MSWAKTGFDSLDDESNFAGSGGGEKKEYGPRRVWMPANKTTRFMWLDDVPFSFWEQQFKWGPNGWRNWVVHLKRNGIAPHHPLDDVFPPFDKQSPSSVSFVGYTTVVNLTGYTNKSGEKIVGYCELYGAKAGSKKNPGILHKLRRLKEKHGRLRGLVFDVFRSGSQAASVGDDFDLVDKVEPTDAAIFEYLKQNGFKGEGCPQPFKYSEVFTPMTVDQLQALTDEISKARGNGGGGGSSFGGDEQVSYGGKKVSGGGWDDDGDDVPPF